MKPTNREGNMSVASIIIIALCILAAGAAAYCVLVPQDEKPLSPVATPAQLDAGLQASPPTDTVDTATTAPASAIAPTVDLAAESPPTTSP